MFDLDTLSKWDDGLARVCVPADPETRSHSAELPQPAPAAAACCPFTGAARCPITGAVAREEATA